MQTIVFATRNQDKLKEIKLKISHRGQALKKMSVMLLKKLKDE